jgi:hypothetical protein
MADIPQNYQILDSGDYTVPPELDASGNPNKGFVPGALYILTLKTSSPGDGTATIFFNNGPNGDFFQADDPDMLGTSGITERRFMAPSTRMQITLDATFTNPIQVTIARDTQLVQ